MRLDAIPARAASDKKRCFRQSIAGINRACRESHRREPFDKRAHRVVPYRLRAEKATRQLDKSSPCNCASLTRSTHS